MWGFIDWSFWCCFEMPCQVVCYPTSFLQAIQTGEASPGALPLTTAPHNCSALRPSLTVPETWWLSSGLSRSPENVPLLWADLEQQSAANPMVLSAWEMLWARGCRLAPLHRGAAQHRPADVAGVPTQGQLSWHSQHEKPIYLGKWDAAIGLQHPWKITVCQKEAKQWGSEFLQTI